MTPRARKKPLLPMPAHTCQFPGCGQEYPSIGDFADTDRAALLGGWVYRAGQWSCPGHRDLIPWWPGPARPVLPVRVPGVTRRAEVIGVPVAAIENVPRPGLPGRDGDQPTAAAGPGHLQCDCGHTVIDDRECTCPKVCDTCGPEDCCAEAWAKAELAAGDLEPLPPLPERVPQATVAAWQAAIRDQLSEQALKGEVPLESLAAEPEEDEADEA